MTGMNEQKEKYYVNLNPISMDAISPIKVDDMNLIQYEIEATTSELNKLQHLLSEVQAHDMELSNLFTFKHFNNKIADADRDETQRGWNAVYKQLYELGTPPTKQAIEEINLINDDM